MTICMARIWSYVGAGHTMDSNFFKLANLFAQKLKKLIVSAFRQQKKTFQWQNFKMIPTKCSVSRNARHSSKLETPCLPFCSHLKNNVSHRCEVMSLLWVDSQHNGMSDVSPAVMERPRDAFWNKLAPNWLSVHTEVGLCSWCGPIIWLLLQTFRQEKQCWEIINTLSLIWSVFKRLWVSFGRVKKWQTTTRPNHLL